MTTTPTTTTLVCDHIGILAVNDGIVFYLTPCCRASVKGSSNSPTGACCRACYQPVPEALGGAWMATNELAWQWWAKAWHTAEDRVLTSPGNAALIDQMIAHVKDTVTAVIG